MTRHADPDVIDDDDRIDVPHDEVPEARLGRPELMVAPLQLRL